MSPFRYHLMRHRRLAAGLVALALMLRLLVPGGYMIGGSAGSITIELCSGYGPQKMVMAMPGMAHHSGQTSEHGKAEMPCAFAGLTALSLGAADAPLLAAAIGFIVQTVFRAMRTPARRGAVPHLRPPSRGPPTHT